MAIGIPHIVYKSQFSEPLIQDNNPVPGQIIKIEETIGAIKKTESRLEVLGRKGNRLKDGTDISEISNLIRKLVKNLEELNIED